MGDFIVTGLHYGEHMREPSGMLEHIKTYGKDCKLAMIRTAFSDLADSSYYEQWARYCKENKIYFCFLYTQSSAPNGETSHLKPEIVKKIYDIAGPYFIGDSLGELGCTIRILYESNHKNMTMGGSSLNELDGKRL